MTSLHPCHFVQQDHAVSLGPNVLPGPEEVVIGGTHTADLGELLRLHAWHVVAG